MTRDNDRGTPLARGQIARDAFAGDSRRRSVLDGTSEPHILRKTSRSAAYLDTFDWTTVQSALLTALDYTRNRLDVFQRHARGTLDRGGAAPRLRSSALTGPSPPPIAT